MNFVQAVRSFFVNFIIFSGRTPRSGFGYVILFNLLCNVIAGIVDYVLFSLTGIYFMVGFLYQLIVLLPNVALASRRLHDMNMSGWWQIPGIICVILAPTMGMQILLLSLFKIFIGVATIYILVLCLCRRGTRGDNRFGPDPLATEAAPVSPA